jgi:hypothetical protein
VRDDNERARELAREIADRLKRRGSLPEVIGDLPLGSHPKRRPAPAELRKNRARPGPPNSAGGTR